MNHKLGYFSQYATPLRLLLVYCIDRAQASEFDMFDTLAVDLEDAHF